MGAAILTLTGCFAGLVVFLFGASGWYLVWYCRDEELSSDRTAAFGFLGFVFMVAGLAAIGQTLRMAGL